MAHTRIRHALQPLRKLASFWPVVGVVGLRQSGKTTLLEKQAKVPHYLSLDDDALVNEAKASGKVFLSRYECPLVLDEVQKAPGLFDAIKRKVDKNRVSGQYYLTGSIRFTSLELIRESLTGRIGILQLQPLTLSEVLKKDLRAVIPVPLEPPRFTIEEFSRNMTLGGLPVPLFSRDLNQRWNYFSQWTQTLLLRDLRQLIPGAYDPELALQLLQKIGALHLAEELPTLKTIPWPAKKIGKYLNGLENAFVLRKINPHPAGVGQPAYYFGDAGLAWYFMNQAQGLSGSLALAKHYLLNEIFANLEYSQQPALHSLTYFQNSKSRPVDLIWNETPLKVIGTSSLRNQGWEERSLQGALKKLGSNKAYFIAPVEKKMLLGKSGIGVLPWTSWS